MDLPIYRPISKIRSNLLDFYQTYRESYRDSVLGDFFPQPEIIIFFFFAISHDGYQDKFYLFVHIFFSLEREKDVGCDGLGGGVS